MQTISLHNIRFELRQGGDEVWVMGAKGERLVGSIRRNPESGRWEIRLMGMRVLSFEDEARARRVFLKAAAKVIAGV